MNVITYLPLISVWIWLFLSLNQASVDLSTTHLKEENLHIDGLVQD